MGNNAQKIQAILYANGGEMKKDELAKLLQVTNDEVLRYVLELKQLIKGTGLELIETGTMISLRSASEFADFVSIMQKSNHEKDIGSAGLEVLAVVLYKDEVSRIEIDYIRGVNSSGTIRQLVLRGLLEKTKSSNHSRSWIYSATPELFSHLGISSRNELPDYEELKTALNWDDPEVQNQNE